MSVPLKRKPPEIFSGSLVYTFFSLVPSGTAHPMNRIHLLNLLGNLGKNAILYCFRRIWWMSSFLMSVILCVIVILSVWSTWKNHPVTVTFNDQTTPINEIPFPAITICTTQKFDAKVDSSSHDRFATGLYASHLQYYVSYFYVSMYTGFRQLYDGE